MDEEPSTDDFEFNSVTTRTELAGYLRRLHIRADRPSLRELEYSSKHSKPVLYRSTVSDMLAGKRMPSRAVLMAFVRACGVHPDRLPPWRRAWERVAEREASSQANAGSKASQQESEPSAENEAEVIIHSTRREASRIIRDAVQQAEQILDQAESEARSGRGQEAPTVLGHDGPSVPADEEPKLTNDEVALLAEIASGVTADAAARRLELSARTLRRRLRMICDRLGAETPIEAVTWAARRNLI